VRYVGQSFEIGVKWSPRFESAFHTLHRERYGYSDPKRPTEIVSARVRATGVTDKPRLSPTRGRSGTRPRPAHLQRVFFGARPDQVPVYQRDSLAPGVKIKGPAIITEYSATTLVPSGRIATTDRWLNLVIE
jgi:N-methylhydantoinase A